MAESLFDLHNLPRWQPVRRLSRFCLFAAFAVMLANCSALSLFKSDKNQPGANEPYPNLASVPERPAQSESAADRGKIAQGLVADREHAAYVDAELRGGLIEKAPPPPSPMPGSQPRQDDDATGATTSDNNDEDEDPGFFKRLFGGKKKAAEVSGSPAASLAQPTTPVAVQSAPDATSPTKN